MALKMNGKVAPPKPTLQDYGQHLKDDKEVIPVQAQVMTESKKDLKSEFKLESSTEVTAHPGMFVSKPLHFMVGVEGSRTINLGNYESARIGVTLTVPCDPEHLEAAYEFGSDWLSGKIEEVESAIKTAKGLPQ